MAGAVLVHDGDLIMGDKFLYDLTEAKDSKYRVAGELLDSANEVLSGVFVTAARAGLIEDMQGYLLFAALYANNNIPKQYRLAGYSLDRRLWDIAVPTPITGSPAIYVDGKRNILLSYPYHSGGLVSGNNADSYMYIDGMSGAIVGEFSPYDYETRIATSGLGPPTITWLDRDEYLPGYDYARDNPNPGDGWTYAANTGWTYASGGPGTTPPSYINSFPGMWAAMPAIAFVQSHFFPISNGWMRLFADRFYWTRRKSTEAETFLCAVQYAVVAIEGGPPEVKVTYERKARARNYRVGSVWHWEFELISESGQQISSNLTANEGVVKTIPVLGGILLYGNTVADNFRNYHKISNDGEYLGNLDNPVPGISDTHGVAVSESSRYLLINSSGGGGYTNAYALDGLTGLDATPVFEAASDRIQNVFYINGGGDFAQVSKGTPDTSFVNTYHQIWRVAPSATEKVARILALNGASSIFNYSYSPSSGGSYLGNGFGWGKSYSRGTYTLLKFNDFAAGSTVLNHAITKSITHSGVAYSENAKATRPQAFIDPGI